MALPNGLVAHWKLNNNAVDSAGSNDGTLIGAPTFVRGKIGQGLQLDGATQYVCVSDSAVLKFGTAMTISLWGYWPAPLAATSQYFVAKRDGATVQWIFYKTAANTIGINGANTAVVQGTDTVSADTWYNIVGVWSGTTGKIYLNTTPDSGGDLTITALSDAACDLFLGARGDGVGGATLFNDGILDDIRIYNRTLNQDERKIIYNAGMGGEDSSELDSVERPGAFRRYNLKPLHRVRENFR